MCEEKLQHGICVRKDLEAALTLSYGLNQDLYVIVLFQEHIVIVMLFVLLHLNVNVYLIMCKKMNSFFYFYF